MNFRSVTKFFAGMIAALTAFAVAPYLIPPPPRKLYMRRELVSPDDQFVEIDGFTMRYRVQGEGTPLIFVHGFASSVVTWYRNLAPLARDHRVYAIDLKGWGLSDKPAEGDYSLHAHADHLRAFMRTLGIVRAVIVGHSMGGAIALHLALNHPEAVSGLVLVDPAGARPFPLLSWVGRVMNVPPIQQWLKLGFQYVFNRDEWITREMPRAYHDPATHFTPQMKDALRQPFQTEGFVEALLHLTRNVRYNSLDGRLREICCPTLVLWGEHDRVLPLNDCHYFTTHIPHAKLVILSESGHLPHEEQAAEVNQLIREFVSNLLQFPSHAFDLRRPTNL